MKRILYLTDLYYEAKGRRYCDEDIYMVGKLMDHFDVAMCNLKNSASFEDCADLVIVRNIGPVSGFPGLYHDFISRIKTSGIKTFNEFKGKADMLGKQYLLDLTQLGYPVIPTIDRIEDFSLLPESDRYVIKPKDGADSIGLEFLSKDELFRRNNLKEMLIQPAIDFVYEVSFYFIDNKLEYALYAPDKTKRWELKRYDYSTEDADFAKKFIEWNDISHGIQRVDACRTRDGRLLLVELEDLDPYLSIGELDEKTREQFITDFISAINNQLDHIE